MEFVDFENRKIILCKTTHEKINERHPEVTLEQLKETLFDPDEVRESRHKAWSQLYYRITLKKNRFICVVVKLNTSDGHNYIETAYTSSKVKAGEVVYSRPPKEQA